jgi:ankyrin repeat protein
MAASFFVEGSAPNIMEKFIKACEVGDRRTVENLMSTVSESRFPRKQLEVKLRPPMYWACKSGNLEIVKLLVDHYPGCDPSFVNESGSSLLYIACARGHISVVHYLNMIYSMSPKEPNSLGTTPIFVAAYNGHFEMMKYLIYKFNCDPRKLNPKGESLLHIACDRNSPDHWKIARYLVQEHKLDPSLKSAFKKTPLHSACGGGNLFITRYLIEELHCKVNVFDQAGYTPIHIACRNGCDDVVQYFIANKHDLHLYDNSGYMPLHVGCRFRRKNVVKALLEQGNIDPNVRTITDQTPLQITQDEDVDIVRCLIKHGARTSGIEMSIFREYRLKYPLCSIIHAFVIGHSASGKSTLTEALQHSTPFFKRANIDVKPHTVGVIPIEFDSPEFGKIVMYDFAGDYEFHPSHAALLEHSKFASPPLFILVLNLLDATEESKR